jgi:hypothetical protein
LNKYKENIEDKSNHNLINSISEKSLKSLFKLVSTHTKSIDENFEYYDELINLISNEIKSTYSENNESTELKHDNSTSKFLYNKSPLYYDYDIFKIQKNMSEIDIDKVKTLEAKNEFESRLTFKDGEAEDFNTDSIGTDIETPLTTYYEEKDIILNEELQTYVKKQIKLNDSNFGNRKFFNSFVFIGENHDIFDESSSSVMTKIKDEIMNSKKENKFAGKQNYKICVENQINNFNNYLYYYAAITHFNNSSLKTLHEIELLNSEHTEDSDSDDKRFELEDKLQVFTQYETCLNDIMNRRI